MGFPVLPPQGGDARKLATVINLAMRGKVNATTKLTLNPGASMTVLTDQRIGPDSFIALAPLTDSAAGALPTTFISERRAGGATVTHVASSATDRHFCVLIIG